jgi:iron complex transport system substrate-binding protein
MRIVSLLASGTEIVCALGAGDSLVGRSHECDNPPWVCTLPRCTEPAFDVSVSSGEINAEVSRRIRSGEPLFRVDEDRIRELAPDLIITQIHCQVCAVTPAGVPSAGRQVRMLTLRAGSLQGVFDDILRVAEALGKEAEGRSVVCREQRRLAAVRSRTDGLPRPSVVMLEWTDPIFAMANWGPELVEIANGDLLIGKKGEYSSAMAFDRVLEADPEYLIIAPCGFDLRRTLREREVLERHSGWHSLRAVSAGRVAFADGNLFFNRSGMTIARTAEILAEILHGLKFETSTENAHWVWDERKQ